MPELPSAAAAPIRPSSFRAEREKGGQGPRGKAEFSPLLFERSFLRGRCRLSPAQGSPVEGCDRAPAALIAPMCVSARGRKITESPPAREQAGPGGAGAAAETSPAQPTPAQPTGPVALPSHPLPIPAHPGPAPGAAPAPHPRSSPRRRAAPLPGSTFIAPAPGKTPLAQAADGPPAPAPRPRPPPPLSLPFFCSCTEAAQPGEGGGRRKRARKPARGQVGCAQPQVPQRYAEGLGGYFIYFLIFGWGKAAPPAKALFSGCKC